MDPVILAAAGGDVWTFLAEKAVLWPASFFLAHGVLVGFHKMEVGDFVVTGYGVPHSGFNAGTNVASAVNLACPAWLAHAIEHEACWRGKIGMLIPFENPLVLSALKLAAGKWCFGDAKSYEACDPAEFRRDLRVMTSFLTEYLDCILAYMRTDSRPAWKGENAVFGDLQAAPHAVKQFVTDNAIKPAGHGLVLPTRRMES